MWFGHGRFAVGWLSSHLIFSSPMQQQKSKSRRREQEAKPWDTSAQRQCKRQAARRLRPPLAKWTGTAGLIQLESHPSAGGKDATMHAHMYAHASTGTLLKLAARLVSSAAL